MTVKVRVEGLREMERALMEMKTSTAGGVVRRAMKKAFAPFADAAKAAAPIGPTGNLKDGITVSSKLNRNQSREAGFRRGKGTEIMYAGADAPHAHLVEFGTGPRFHKSGKYVGEMPPNPFMRGAWDGTKGAVLDDLTDLMRIEIDKAVARAQRKAMRG